MRRFLYSLRLPLVLLVIVISFGVWSAIYPNTYLDWFEESFPVLVVLPLLILTRNAFPLTPLLYSLVALHCCVLMMGGHYTYALTPFGDWLRDILHTRRNPYDRLGHLFQGFVPAIAIRELLTRTSPLKPGKWMAAIIFFGCMGISALYELLEYAVAVTTGSSAEAFLGTQGDPWDTQNDMLCAGIGALLALATMQGWHDRQLKTLADSGRRVPL